MGPRKGGSASVRAATRVKPEQASKRHDAGAEPPLDRRRLPGSSEHPTNDDDPPAGVMGAARTHTGSRNAGDLDGAPHVRGNGSMGARRRQESEEPIVPRKPGNAGGGKGLWFGVRGDEPRGG